MGLVYLATYLRERCGIQNIRIFDRNFDDIEHGVMDFKPDSIGLSSMTVYYSEAIRLATFFRKKLSCPIILGGVHISTLPESLDPVFDAGIIGEGEQTLADLVDLLAQSGSLSPDALSAIPGLVFFDGDTRTKTEQRPPLDINSLPLPDCSLLNPQYFAPHDRAGQPVRRAFVLTSRSCPYRCRFCSTSRFWGKVRQLTPSRCADLIEHFITQYGSDHIVIMDDLFATNTARLRAIHDELVRRGLLDQITAMDCQVRANLMDEEMCEVLQSLKVRMVSLGFESGSDRILKYLKGDNVSVEDNRRTVELCNRYGFQLYGSLMFGCPGETLADMHQTNAFIDYLARQPSVANVWSFIATPFPATPFWELALERGFVNNEDMDWTQLSHQNMEHPPLLDQDIDPAAFRAVFLDGRKKLQRIKMKLVWRYLTRHPLQALRIFLQSPGYSIRRVLTRLFRQ
jgi:radical SAM superfamily enzyme YgiQ (UPF0313 family)